MWRDLDLWFVSFYKSNYIAEKWMLNDYKSTAQNRAVPNVAIMVISRLFNSHIFMYDMLHRLLFDETIIVI